MAKVRNALIFLTLLLTLYAHEKFNLFDLFHVQKCLFVIKVAFPTGFRRQNIAKRFFEATVKFSEENYELHKHLLCKSC